MVHQNCAVPRRGCDLVRQRALQQKWICCVPKGAEGVGGSGRDGWKGMSWRLVDRDNDGLMECVITGMNGRKAGTHDAL